MKINKIMALGIMLLIGSPMILKSVVVQEPKVRTMIGEHLDHQESTEPAYVFDKTHVDPSDEEILAKQEFEGPINEYTVQGWPKAKMSSQSFADIRKHYNRWATVDREGAAAQFSPTHVH